jgi:hypothetical protein
MTDTSGLFESLSRATEFTVTEDHLTLLRHTYRVYWDPGIKPGLTWLGQATGQRYHFHDHGVSGRQ